MTKRTPPLGLIIVFRFFRIPLISPAPAENAVHAGEAGIYDSRALTLQLDDLANSLRKNPSFVDLKILASTLRSLQGLSSQDPGQAFSANGCAGPNAASVFSDGAATAATTANVSN